MSSLDIHVMLCPICNVDLSFLDPQSRNEHIEVCVNNGPSLLETDESGQVVIVKRIQAGKQRKICPVCSKTFQNLHSHYKTCAVKNDVIPDIMMEQWEQLNSGLQKPKKFPKEMLDNFVAKCIKEGRIGEQVDIARALSMSMSDPSDCSYHPIESDAITQNIATTTSPSESNSQSNTSIATSKITQSSDVTLISSRVQVPLVLKQPSNAKGVQQKQKLRKLTRLEAVDDATKRNYINVRIQKELNASRDMRYKEIVRQQLSMGIGIENVSTGDDGEDEMNVIDVSSLDVINDEHDSFYSECIDTLFYRARMKSCDGSELCLSGFCSGHEFSLLIEEFSKYTGKSIDHDVGLNPSSSGGHMA